MTSLPLVLAVVLAGPPDAPRAHRAAPPAPRSAVAPSAASPELSDADLKERIDTWLDAIHVDAVSPEQWSALGPRAVPMLDSVLHDPQALPSRRARAVEALSAIGGARAREIVLQVARSEDEPFGVRASALRMAPRLLSPRELSSELRPVLERARDVPVRATAAEVLARHGGAQGCSAVRAQLEREGRSQRAHFEGAADRCGLRIQ